MSAPRAMFMANSFIDFKLDLLQGVNFGLITSKEEKPHHVCLTNTSFPEGGMVWKIRYCLEAYCVTIPPPLCLLL